MIVQSNNQNSRKMRLETDFRRSGQDAFFVHVIVIVHLFQNYIDKYYHNLYTKIGSTNIGSTYFDIWQGETNGKSTVIR